MKTEITDIHKDTLRGNRKDFSNTKFLKLEN